MQLVAHDPGGVARSSYSPGPRRQRSGEPSSRVSPEAGRRERPLILVVDDEDAIRLLCRVNLRLEGIDTAEAADGATALELARELKPDLILLDVMMPQADGWQVAEALRRDPEVGELGHVVGLAGVGEDAGVHARVQRLDPSLEALGEPGEVLDLGDRQAQRLDEGGASPVDTRATPASCSPRTRSSRPVLS